MAGSIRAVVVAGLLAGLLPGAAVPAVQDASNHRVSHSLSTNWSGYDLTGHGPYTSISASWVQPAVDCRQTPTGWSSFWVGLDGETSGTVEQTGTEADCASGSPVYYGWYEMYPRVSVNYANPVAPGDSLSATVSYQGAGTFRLTLTDRTAGWTRTVTPRQKRAALASAEVVAEAPASSGGVLPLADFGTVGFTGAAVNGATLTGSTPGIDPITMASGSTVRARPGTLSNGSFSDSWQHP